MKYHSIFIFKYITGKPYQISQVGFVEKKLGFDVSYTHTRQKGGCEVKR